MRNEILSCHRIAVALDLTSRIGSRRQRRTHSQVMPVIGHAITGVAAALYVRPHASVRSAAVAAPLWIPSLVIASYLPDVMGQLLWLAGIEQARAASHSVLLGSLGAALLSMVGRPAGRPTVRVVLVVWSLVIVHLALDMLLASDVRPWWPFSNRPLRAPSILSAPPTLLEELTIFAGLLPLLLARRRWQVAGPPVVAWSTAAFVLLIITTAALTHHLRDRREQALVTARQHAATGRYQQALQWLERADRWPYPARPGRVEHLAAECHVAFGNRDRAEALYLQAYRADPDYFWVVADLATFYASAHLARTERERLAAPYLEQLRKKFSTHRQLPEILTRVERLLAQS